MANFRHEQQKEIERLKFEINSLMDRRLKLYSHEFNVLPEAWQKLFDAFIRVSAVTSVIQTHPDLDKMQPAQLLEFLNHAELRDWQKEEIRQATDKTGLHSEYEWQYRLSLAVTATNESLLFLRQNGIFIQDDLKEKFDAASKIISDTIFEFQSNLR
jgi:hypothetical protein